jgi:DHA2 family methylenomycin A resistance protein-like MFS transporter
LVNVAVYGLLFVLSVFFQRGQHLSPLATGLDFAPLTIGVFVGNLSAGGLSNAIGAGKVIASGAMLGAAGTAALLPAHGGTPYIALAAQLVALGLGVGLVVPAITSALLGSVDPSRSGVASGTLNTLRQTGSVLGVALFGSLVAGPGRLVPGLHLALGIAAVLVLAIILLARSVDA